MALVDPLANARFTPLTYGEGSEGSAEISPDGRFVTFLGDASGEVDLWRTQVGTEHSQNLTLSIEPLASPGILRTSGFTPDGAEVWFALLAGLNMIMPQTGGTAATIPGARCQDARMVRRWRPCLFRQGRE